MRVDEPYLKLAGAVIRQAIFDYKTLRFNKTADLSPLGRRAAWEDSKGFLFTNRLEKYLEFMGIDEMTRTSEIRKEAMKPMGPAIKMPGGSLYDY